MDVDSALAQVGGYKRWNLFVFLLVGMSLNISLCWHGLSIVFVGWEPPHTCLGSGRSQINISHAQHSSATNLWTNLSEGNQSHFDPKCYIEKYDHQTGDVSVVKCNNWTFENNGYHTIVEEWSLVCDRNYMAELSQILYQSGALTGELFSFVVDKYGRKKLHIITHICICIIGMINAYSVSYFMFALSKASMGFFVAVNVTSGIMLLLEFFDARRRTLPGIMLQIFWNAFHVILPGLAYLIKGWNTLQMALSLVSVIMAVLLITIPESPSWLIARGETEKAEKILRNIAKWNKVKLDQKAKLLSEIMEPIEQIVTNEESSDIKIIYIKNVVILNTSDQETDERECISNKEVSDINPEVDRRRRMSKFSYLLDPVILKYLVIASLLWFSNCFMYYGIILATPSLKGDRFLNFLLLGLVEFPATFLSLVFTKKLGRRLTCSASLFLAGCSVAVIIFIPRGTDTMTRVSLAFVILSKGFVSASFAIMMLYSKEMFPTNIRATCCGVCQLCGRIGSLSAPMTAYMTKTENMFWVPNILFGVVSIIVSFLLLFLPETNNQPLPETVEDCRKLNANKFFSCQRNY